MRRQARNTRARGSEELLAATLRGCAGDGFIATLGVRSVVLAAAATTLSGQARAFEYMLQSAEYVRARAAAAWRLLCGLHTLAQARAPAL